MARSVASVRTSASARFRSRAQSYALRYPSGASNYVGLGSNTLFDSTKPWAISFWANLEQYYKTGQTTAQGLFSFKTDQGVPFVIYMQSTTGNPGINMGGNSAFACSRPNNPRQFITKAGSGAHLITIRFDGVDRASTSSYKLSVDGTDFSLITGTTPSATNHVNTIGVLGVSFSGRGIIGPVWIWNGGTAMTDQQLLDFYNNQALPSGPTFLRYYPHSNGSGTQLTETVAGDHGTLNGTVSWTTSLVVDRSVASVRNTVT